MGLLAQPSEPLLTDRAKRVLKRAQEEQVRLRHPRLSAEHILLVAVS